MRLEKISCMIGYHKCDEGIFYHIRDEKNKSFCRIDKTCSRCGKKITEYMWFPKL